MDKFASQIYIYIYISLLLHHTSLYKSLAFTKRCTFLLVLESTKIYIKIHTKMLLHVLVCDHHQGACI